MDTLFIVLQLAIVVKEEFLNFPRVWFLIPLQLKAILNFLVKRKDSAQVFLSLSCF